MVNEVQNLHVEEEIRRVFLIFRPYLESYVQRDHFNSVLTQIYVMSNWLVEMGWSGQNRIVIMGDKCILSAFHCNYMSRCI